LTISKQWIADGRIIRESIDELDTSYGASYAWAILDRADIALARYMKTKVTAARSPIKAILNELPGGWLTAFAVLKHVALRDAESEEARIMAAWEEVHSVHAEKTTVELVIEGAGITESHFLGVVCEACHVMKVNVAKMLRALNLDEVMEAGIRAAKKPSGFKDRQAILQSAGLYPAATGTIINNSPIAIAHANQAVETIEGLDGFERDTMDSTSFLRGLESGGKRLESPANFVDVTPVPVETHDRE